MALDEDIRLFLQTLEGVPTPSQQTASIDEMRQATHQLWLDRPVPALQATTEDIRIPGRDGADLPLRLYRPPGKQREPLPLLLFMHGGGFVFGSIDTHGPISNRLALDSGAAVLSVGYRLAPEHPFPAAVNDTLDALDWATANPDRLGVDIGQVHVVGDSAGANLAAVAAQVASDTQVPLAGQALIYPVTDLRETQYETRVTRANGFGLSEDDMRWYGQHYLKDPAQAESPLASPITRPDLSGLAPAFIMTAGHDPLGSEGSAYADRLRDAGVAVEHLHLEGANHGVFSNWTEFKAGEITWQALLAWLEGRFRAS